MTAYLATRSLLPTMKDRILALSVTRMILATFATVSPLALVLIVTHASLDKSMRFAWPQSLAAFACLFGYRFYVSRIEKRSMSELDVDGAGRELGAGLIVGATLLLSTIGIIALAGDYRITGYASALVLISPFAEMVLVATFEEILFRGVLFRLTERSLGSWVALILSSVIFAAAHLPNGAISLLSLTFTFVAGLTLVAAYMTTRRLWLPIGIHFAWNFLSDAVFSLPTSGHPAGGIIQGQMAGPDWLTGGSYGVEGSVVALSLFAAVGIVLMAIVRPRLQKAAIFQTNKMEG